MSAPEAVHCSAVIDPRATLARTARIGAFAVIGPEVTIGEDAEVGHHAVLEGRVMVGPRVKIGHGAIVGAAPQDLKYKDGTPSGVRIAADTVIREYATVHRATKADTWTDIGRGCLIMAMSHIAHDCRLADGVIVINYAGITGHCQIGECATIGGLTGLAPFTRVGAYAYIGGCSKVVSDVPPYMLADGVPATIHGVNVVGLRRAGMATEERRQLRDAYRVLYRSGLSPRSAVERLRRELLPSGPVERLIDFILSSRRGICGAPRGVPGSAEGGAPADAESEPVF